MNLHNNTMSILHYEYPSIFRRVLIDAFFVKFTNGFNIFQKKKIEKRRTK